MSAITHSVAPERQQPHFETSADVQVRVLEDYFWEPCEICLTSPSAVCVEIRRPDLDAVQKFGALSSLEPIERRFFCAVHVCAADMVYRSY